MPTYWAFRAGDSRGWAAEDAGRLEVFHPSASSTRHALAGQTADQVLRQVYGGALVVEETEVEPGCYYPRVWRPEKPGARVVERDAWAAAAAAARIIFSRLGDVLRFVEPDPNNLLAFGHELRMLLILACTEVESSWTGVLKANRYPAGKWTTNDYVKLLKPMKLDEWSVELAPALPLGALKPFAGWSGTAATQTLPWYDAYNKVKHFREDNLPLATLRHTIDAVAAVYVMFVVQFGTWEGFGAGDISLLIFQGHNPREIAAGGDLFRLRDEPTFAPGEIYAPPRVAGRHSWRPAMLIL